MFFFCLLCFWHFSPFHHALWFHLQRQAERPETSVLKPLKIHRRLHVHKDIAYTIGSAKCTCINDSADHVLSLLAHSFITFASVVNTDLRAATQMQAMIWTPPTSIVCLHLRQLLFDHCLSGFFWSPPILRFFFFFCFFFFCLLLSAGDQRLSWAAAAAWILTPCIQSGMRCPIQIRSCFTRQQTNLFFPSPLCVHASTCARLRDAAVTLATAGTD